MPKYSIVVPFHNEQESVTSLYDRLKAVMEATGDTFELVFVDDGSMDRTYKLLREIVTIDSRVVVVKLRRNFGQTSALAAGFSHAQGEYVIAMDGDLQHDPDDIPKFLEMLEQGYDLFSGWRKERVDNFVMRRIPSRIANWAVSKLIWHLSVMGQHGPMLISAAVLIVFGGQMLALGLLGDLQVRNFQEPNRRVTYTVAHVLRSQSQEQAVNE